MCGVLQAGRRQRERGKMMESADGEKEKKHSR